MPGIPKWKYFGSTKSLRYKITKVGQQRLDWFNKHKDQLILPETPWNEIEAYCIISYSCGGAVLLTLRKNRLM